MLSLLFASIICLYYLPLLFAAIICYVYAWMYVKGEETYYDIGNIAKRLGNDTSERHFLFSSLSLDVIPFQTSLEKGNTKCGIAGRTMKSLMTSLSFLRSWGTYLKR